jgi:MFS family permease
MQTPAVPGASPLPIAYNTRFVWTISLVVALGGLLFGYDWVVISGADLFYEKYFCLTSAHATAWAKSCALVGCLFGAVLSGGLSDRFGRKRLLIVSAFLFAISSLGTGWAHSFTAFVWWRIVGGAAIGLASNLSPMYIAEIAPAHIRGKLVSLNQLTIVIGILLAQLVNWWIAQPVAPGASVDEILNSWNAQSGWRWMFIATTVPSLLFFCGMFFVPESPRWLAKSGQSRSARAVLVTLVVAAIACYACTLAPVTWVVLSEIFPNRIRGAAMSVAVFALWTGCFTLTYTFPLLNERLGPAGTFWAYAAVCVAGWGYVRAKLPETKGKTLEEIERELVD